MSAEKIVYAALSEHTPLTAIVGDRIYPLVIPEAARLPAVTYDVVSRREHKSLDSPAATVARLVFASVRIAAAVQPNDYGTLTAIMAAIRTALDGRTNTSFGGALNVVVHSGQESADAFDPETQIASRSRVVQMTYNLPQFGD